MFRLFAALIALVGLTGPSLAAKTLTPLELYERSCANVLNFVPRIVRREAVAAIVPDAHVLIHNLCRGVPYNDSGNASGLTRVIAANAALSRALADHGWRPEDVIAIAIRGTGVELYVHRDPISTPLTFPLHPIR